MRSAHIAAKITAWHDLHRNKMKAAVAVQPIAANNSRMNQPASAGVLAFHKRNHARRIGKPGIKHLKLIESKMVCFYDPDVRKPPVTLKDYIACRYVDVRFSTTESSQQVLPASLTSKLSEPTVAVPNFNAVTAFIKGTDLITTQLSVMEHGSLKGLAWSPLPVRTKSRPLFLLWHERYDEDPGHRWMRQRIKDTADSIVSP